MNQNWHQDIRYSRGLLSTELKRCRLNKPEGFLTHTVLKCYYKQFKCMTIDALNCRANGYNPNKSYVRLFQCHFIYTVNPNAYNRQLR